MKIFNDVCRKYCLQQSNFPLENIKKLLRQVYNKCLKAEINEFVLKYGILTECHHMLPEKHLFSQLFLSL